MSPLLRRSPLLLAAVLAWSGPAAASSGWALDWRFPPAEPPPFSRQELESAVNIRRPPQGADVSVGWDAGGGGTIEASSHSRRRQVLLGEAQGSEAARLVALAVMDVLRPLPELESAPVASGEARPGRLGLALVGGVNRGATSAGFAFEPAVRACWGGPRLAIAAEVGYGQGRGRADGQTLVLHMIPVRLGMLLRQGRWALNAGALLRPYQMRGLAGGASLVWGTLFGGHLALERSFAVRSQLAALASVGVDLLANRVDLRVRGRSLLHSGRVAPMARLGLSWGTW